MHTVQILNDEIAKISRTNTTSIQCFVEKPSKTENDKTISRIGAFDLFNLFTADIIRSKTVFTR